MPRQYSRVSPDVLFWSHVDKHGPVSEYRPDLGPCWLWTASRATNGYGRFWFGAGPDRRLWGAHQVAFILSGGAIPDGLEVDHLCRVRHCVNPAHMEPVTHRVNTLRGVAPSAINARKDRCSAGHLFDEQNTHIGPNGERSCRTCDREGYRRRVGWRGHDLAQKATCAHCGVTLKFFFPKSAAHFCAQPACAAARLRYYRQIGWPSQVRRPRT